MHAPGNAALPRAEVLWCHSRLQATESGQEVRPFDEIETLAPGASHDIYVHAKFAVRDFCSHAASCRLRAGPDCIDRLLAPACCWFPPAESPTPASAVLPDQRCGKR
jgi:hypothetical protein